MFISEEGFLLRRTDSGESYFLMVVFLKESGIRNVLARKRSQTRSGLQLPDLFDHGEYTIEQKDPSRPAYLKEFNQLKGFPGISRGYRRLTAACELARFYERNLLHLEHFEPVWELLGQALQAFEDRPEPQLVLFKALYAFARSEGYPVKAHWLEGRPAKVRKQIIQALQAPGDSSTADKEDLARWTTELYRFFRESTDLLPPDIT